MSKIDSKVVVGEGLENKLAQSLKCRSKRVALFYDRKLKKEASRYARALKKRNQVMLIPISANEKSKSFESIEPLYSKLIEHNMDRHSAIVALGGGSVGDAIGYVAASYMRGIQWVGVPTTLLAQVDSGIGGKTGVNHRKGKNLIGAIWQPSLVMSDLKFLRTLPKRDRVSGLGEILKYGLIMDRKFFEQAWKKKDQVIAGKGSLKPIVEHCTKLKMKLVAQDEWDEFG